jgi:hypothetical protein
VDHASDEIVAGSSQATALTSGREECRSGNFAIRWPEISRPADAIYLCALLSHPHHLCRAVHPEVILYQQSQHPRRAHHSRNVSSKYRLIPLQCKSTLHTPEVGMFGISWGVFVRTRAHGSCDNHRPLINQAAQPGSGGGDVAV